MAGSINTHSDVREERIMSLILLQRGLFATRHSPVGRGDIIPIGSCLTTRNARAWDDMQITSLRQLQSEAQEELPPSLCFSGVLRETRCHRPRAKRAGYRPCCDRREGRSRESCDPLPVLPPKGGRGIESWDETRENQV